jgi:hypothetical protein
VTKRRVRVQKVTKPRPREVRPLGLDPRDPDIVRVKEHLYTATRPHRAA